MTSLYVGADPGASGYICFLYPKTKRIEWLDNPGGVQTLRDLFSNITTIHSVTPINMIGIEAVHAIQGTSAGSNFKFGFNTGLLHGVLKCTGIGIDMVRPLEWQRLIKAPTKKKAGSAAGLKKAIAGIALTLYPHAELYGPRGGLIDGKSDSLMIAHYMYIKYEGGL